MSGAYDPITEFDLMAFADGRLDPLRRQDVQAHLARSPEDAAKVEAIIEQNEALRQALGHIAEEPLPPRLEQVLRQTPAAAARRPWLKAASVAALLVVSGAGGWWLGASSSGGAGDPAAPPVFLQALAPQPAGENVATGLDSPVSSFGGAEVVETSPPWFSDRVTLELAAPSLGGSFAAPEMQRLIDIDGRPTVRFEITGPDGRPLALYLQTRPSEDIPAIHIIDDATGATAYWREGPLLWALKGDASGTALEALARQIGSAIELTPRLGPADAEHTRLPAAPATLAEVAREDTRTIPQVAVDQVTLVDG